MPFHSSIEHEYHSWEEDDQNDASHPIQNLTYYFQFYLKPENSANQRYTDTEIWEIEDENTVPLRSTMTTHVEEEGL